MNELTLLERRALQGAIYATMLLFAQESMNLRAAGFDAAADFAAARSKTLTIVMEKLYKEGENEDTQL
jgi:hypothetical protein